MAYPNNKDPFILDTDASDFGIGAVLSQVQDGEEKVLAYASRALGKAERNYCVTRKELLAGVDFMMEFRQYLYGRILLWRTDHSALRWISNFKNAEGQLARWISTLAEFNYEVEHRPGKKHINADSMSRMPCHQCGREEGCHELFPGKGRKWIKTGEEHKCCVLAINPTWTLESLREEQMKDLDIKPIIEAKDTHSERPCWEAIASNSKITKIYWAVVTH